MGFAATTITDGLLLAFLLMQPLHCQRYALLSPTYGVDLEGFSYNDWLTSAQECLDFAWDVDKPNVVVFCWVPADTMCMWTDKASVVGCFKNGTGAEQWYLRSDGLYGGDESHCPTDQESNDLINNYVTCPT